nr:hypothetical protein [Tanacetum cinerariifolium]
MATTIEQQMALDEALVPITQRLRIGRSNFRLPSDIQSKESTLQATAKVHHHSIRFKMDNKKHIVNLETFRDMLHICPRIPGQSFDELPFEEEILDFLRFLGYSAQIRTLTDVNINKLFPPWRSFGAVINKCLTGKSSGFDSFRLSQAQILWGLYYNRNIDYAFLIWEDFVYQVEHKNHKKSNEMYYPKFTKNTQQYGAILPIELTNEEIRNTKAYKEYYAYATGEVAPKPKASARRKRSGSDSSTTPPTAVASPRPTIAATLKLTTAAKGKQPAKATKAKSLSALSEPGGLGTDKGTGSKLGVPDVPSDDSDEEISWNSSDDEDTDSQEKDRHDDKCDEKDESDDGEDDDDDKDGDERDDDDDDDDDEEEITKIDMHDDTERGGNDDEGSESDKESDDEETKEEESFDPIPRTLEDSEDNGNDEEDQGFKDGEKEWLNEEEEADELYRDIDINQGRGLQLSQDIKDSHVTLTPVNLMMNEAVRMAVQIQTDQLRDSYQRENDEFLRTIDDNMKRIIKEQALVEAYEADKIILDTYGERVILKRRRDDDDDQDTSLDFSNFIMNRLRVDTLTPELLARPTYELMKGSCNSLTELEYHLQEVYKSMTNQLDWVNPEGQQYPHNLLHPLPLIPDNRGRRVILFAHFINNDLEYLREGASNQKYTTSVTKTKAAYFGLIKCIEDLVPRTMWIQEPINYDKHALWEVSHWGIDDLVPLTMWIQEPINYDKHAFWGVSHWGWKRQQFYGFAVNRESALDVYSKRRIIAVTDLKIVEWCNYKHLDWISLSNLTVEERFAFNISLRMFTRSIVIQRCVEDLQQRVESYQKRLNLTKPDTYRSDLKRREAYTAYSNPKGFVYQNKDKKNRLMRIDKFYKFSDGTLNDVRNALDDRLKGIRMQYLPQTIWRKGDKDRVAAMIQAINKMLKIRRIMRSLERFVGG